FARCQFVHLSSFPGWLSAGPADFCQESVWAVDWVRMSTETNTRLHLGAPQISGPLAVYPIFGPEANFRYRSLRDAVSQGVFISEVQSRASVNTVTVTNASDRPVLLYEGELITGAQQNRTIDQPVLVPAAAKLDVAVSCVEHGRWDHSRHGQSSSVSARMSHPGLRAVKRAAANRNRDAGLAARPDQGEVWAVVGASLYRHGVESMSDAFTDLFEAKDQWLAEIRGEIRGQDGQLGAVAQINARPVASDLANRPEVFAYLLPGLLDGYALQALDAIDETRAEPHQASDTAALDFFDMVISSRGRWLPTVGMGDAFTPTRRRINGCGLRAEGELVALSAFPAKAAA
ncbi:MAG: ARPP-1 family domain-containing protein, partial [Solirubrobacteraceae bacterium]